MGVKIKYGESCGRSSAKQNSVNYRADKPANHPNIKAYDKAHFASNGAYNKKQTHRIQLPSLPDS